MSQVKGLLDELVKLSGARIAVIVGRDGFVIEGVSNSGEIDMETVGAVLSTEIWSVEGMGSELNLGKLSQGLIEFTGGIVITALLGEEAILAVISNTKANLGNTRYQIKKRVPKIQEAL